MLQISLLVLALIFLVHSKKEYEESLETLEFVAEFQDQLIANYSLRPLTNSDLSKLRPSVEEEYNIFLDIHDLVKDSISSQVAALKKDYSGNEFLIQKIKLDNQIIERQIYVQNLGNSIIRRSRLTDNFSSFQSMFPLIFSAKEMPNDSLRFEIALLDTIAINKSMNESTINGHSVLEYNSCLIKDDLSNACIDLNPSEQYKLNSWRRYLE